MSKHTPGPWHVRNKGPHWNNPDTKNWVVCWSDEGEQVVDHVYEEADARLIAASPDLLEAAIDARDWLDGERRGGEAEVFYQLLSKLDAAIAKAWDGAP